MEGEHPIFTNRELLLTADGSYTIFVPELDEHYHSINGAIQESKHVFIEAALHHTTKKDCSILEIGFGTGLNAFLTLIEAERYKRHIKYYSVEKFPLNNDITSKLGYSKLENKEFEPYFDYIHKCNWNREEKISDYFSLHKIEGDSNSIVLPEGIDIVYFDAFAPDKQPEMWSQEIFDKLYKIQNTNGILSTYCAKGSVRRMMKEAGYSVERIPGPPGKREMLRATKL